MSLSEDLFAKLDPNTEREKLFATEAAEVLTEHLGKPVETGELKNTARSIASRLASMATTRFEVDDEMAERMLTLEIAICLLVRLDRSDVVVSDLGTKVAAMARKRFFSEKPKKKKDT